MTIISMSDLALSGFHSTNEVVPTSIKVDLSAATWVTIMRVVVPVDPGDLLDVTAWFKVTNDIVPTAYPVGVGAHLWAYDCDSGYGSAGAWWRLDDAGSVGMNVDRDLHHLTLPLAVAYQVPDNWPAGHRMVVVLRADAHSTAWKAGDTLTVDPCGRLTVRRYTTA